MRIQWPKHIAMAIAYLSVRNDHLSKFLHNTKRSAHYRPIRNTQHTLLDVG